MAFTPEESDARIDVLQDVEFRMEDFVESVFNGEYILVVGSEVVLDRKVEPTGDVNRYLLNIVNHELHTHHADFNEVLLHSSNLIDPIRNLLRRDAFLRSMELDDISPELRGLLQLKVFKFVVTTTFDGYVEMLMRSIYGDKLRVVNVCDDRSLADFRNALQSYRKGSIYDEPTLIYAFGKAVSDESKMFARTDNDYIRIIEKWMQFGNRSDQMLEFIQSKRLLALGCKFDDWYFRFFWFILKREVARLGEGEVAITLDGDDRSEQQLGTYLHRTRVYNHQDARAFMARITDALTSMAPDSPFHRQVVEYRSRGGIFISYCSRDVTVATRLFFMLRKRYKNVWFDNARLHGGDDYNRDIADAISSARVFITVLSPTVADDLQNNRTSNYYNDEWRQAAQRHHELAIIPLAVEGYNLRQPYHTSTYEGLIGASLSGIDLSIPDGYGRLAEAIDHHLGITA